MKKKVRSKRKPKRVARKAIHVKASVKKRHTLSLHTFVKTKLERGEQITARYLCTRLVSSDFGPIEVHYFTEAKHFAIGKNFALYGTADLNQKLLQVPKGAVVRIEYEKDVELPPSAKTQWTRPRLKKFNVQYWA